MRKELSPKYLMFAVWSLQKKHQRAAHYVELLEYLHCSRDLLFSTMRKLLYVKMVRRSNAEVPWYVVSMKDYVPMQDIHINETEEGTQIKCPHCWYEFNQGQSS